MTTVRTSTSELELIADLTGDVFVRSDCEGRVTYVSGSIRQYGYEPSQIIGETGEQIVHPDDLEAFRANTCRVLAGEHLSPTGRVHRFRVPDGRWLWVEGNPRVLRDEQGRVTEIVNVFRDVTERVRAEAEAQAQARLLSSVFEQTGVGKALVGLDGRFLDANAAFCALLGYARAALLALDFQSLTHAHDLDADLCLLARLNAGEIASYRMDKRYLRADGDFIWAHLTVSVVRDAQGQPKLYVAEVQDQSQRRAMEEALRRKSAEAQAANVAKSEFLANMSHEIRTPLTAIVGFADLLARRDDLAPDARSHVARIAVASEALLAIVNDILDVSKLEAGQLRLERRPTDLDAVVRSALEMFSARAQENGLSLAFDGSFEAGRHALVDADRLRQVLVNLIGNAVKFTDVGGVRVAARYDACRQRLAVRVEDTGPGVSETEQARLFQRFSQLDASSTRRHGGAGLGLAICKELVAAMGGEIAVQSRPGEGAAFSFTVGAPVTAAPEAPADGADAPLLEGLRVLVVDDNATNRELAGAVLGAVGAEVSEAAGGAEGLGELAAQPFDVVLLDLRMPDLDGREVLRRLRAAAGPNRETPVLAFSAELCADAAGKAGFDGWVTKPVTAAGLILETARAAELRFEAPRQAIG